MGSHRLIAAITPPDAVVGFLEAAGVDVVRLAHSAVPPEEEATELRRRHGAALCGVVAVSDSTVSRAAALNAALATPGAAPHAVALAADKRAMRRQLSGAGRATVRWSAVDSIQDVRHFVNDVGPTIVKPAYGSASRHVMRVDSANDPALDDMASVLTHEHGWIAEELLRGPEFSVETLSWAGRHHMLAVTAKQTGAGFVEVGHRVPAPLSTDTAEQIGSLVSHILDTLHLHDCVSHTELIVTSDGLRVVETHPRIGGDRIGRLVEIVTGVHPLTQLAAALAGLHVDAAPSAGGAAVAFLRAAPGVVTRVDGVSLARRQPGVVEVVVTAFEGDEISEMGSSDDRSGYVLATGITSTEAADRARAAADHIEIMTALR